MSADGEILAAQAAVQRFVRNFGLHQPDRTPCGQPVPVSEAYALIELAKDGPLRQVELGRRLRLEKSSVSRLVSNLVDRGWVHRQPAGDDGRGVLLALTSTGIDATQNQARAREAKFAAILGRVPKAQRGKVIAALELLAEAADEST